MKVFVNALVLPMLIGFSFFAQAGESLVIKKDRVIDFLFLNNKENAQQHLKNYFSTVIPAANKLGYQPVYSFSIKRKPIRGNYHPDNLAIGSWPGGFKERREGLEKLMVQFPDLHARRFDIWSTFNMTNYAIKEDIVAPLSPDNIYVLSAYWKNEQQSFDDFRKNQMERIQKSGGKVILKLEDGRSPFGYLYNPELTIITEWPSQKAFDQFHSKYLHLDQKSIKHANELYLEKYSAKKS